MAAPVFNNASAQAHESYGTSLLLALPASRVLGNLLIAIIGNLNGSPAFVWPDGWTPVDDSTTQGNWSYAYAYVTGSEAAPTVTWSGVNDASGYIYQYSGTKSSSPIGAFNKNHGFSFGAQNMTDPGIVTTADDSTVAMFCQYILSHGTTIDGYTNRSIFDDTHAAFFDVAMGVAGLTSPDLVLAVGGIENWSVAGFEILAEPAPSPPAAPTAVKGAKGYRIVAGPSGPEHTFRTVSVQGTGPSSGLSLGNQETSNANGEYETVYQGPTGASGFPTIFVDGYTGPA